MYVVLKWLVLFEDWLLWFLRGWYRATVNVIYIHSFIDVIRSDFCDQFSRTMSEVDPTTSCGEVATTNETNVEKHSIPEEERDIKKRKTNHSKVEELQSRLNVVLSCIICLDLPKDVVYQVSKKWFVFS